MGSYSNDQINILQDALKLACAELGIPPKIQKSVNASPFSLPEMLVVGATTHWN